MVGFRAVTFDVTGTLLQFRLPPGEYYAKVGAIFGAHVDPKVTTKNFKSELLRMNSEHPNFGLHSGIGWEQWWRQIVHQTFIKSSNSVQQVSTLSCIYEHLMTTYQTPECWVAYAGSLELLQRLSDNKIQLGIISNNDQRLETILKVMDMRKYFKFVLTSYDAGFQKPDPRIFQMAFNLFGDKDLKFNEILHVGDKLYLDYVGAEQVGWKGALVHVKEKSKILKEHPQVSTERLFKNLKDVGEFVI